MVQESGLGMIPKSEPSKGFAGVMFGLFGHIDGAFAGAYSIGVIQGQTGFRAQYLSS